MARVNAWHQCSLAWFGIAARSGDQQRKAERYARYLAEVMHKDKNLSDYLLEIGAASGRG